MSTMTPVPPADASSAPVPPADAGLVLLPMARGAIAARLDPTGRQSRGRACASDRVEVNALWGR